MVGLRRLVLAQYIRLGGGEPGSPSSIVTPTHRFFMVSSVQKAPSPLNAVRYYSTSSEKRPQPVPTTGETRQSPLCCPECGKHFISAENLVYHRRTRHLIAVLSSSEERLERLKEENARLQAELREAEARARCGAPVTQPESVAGTEGLGSSQAIFPAAIFDGRAVSVSMADVDSLRKHPFRLGCGCSELRCVGVVGDDVELGHLGNGGSDAERGPEVLQFTLKLDGYRQRRTGRLMMYTNSLTVRLMSPQYRVEKGDVVLAVGNYGLHRSFDLISKQSVENPILEAGFISLLKSSGWADSAEGRTGSE